MHLCFQALKERRHKENSKLLTAKATKETPRETDSSPSGASVCNTEKTRRLDHPLLFTGEGGRAKHERAKRGRMRARQGDGPDRVRLTPSEKRNSLEASESRYDNMTYNRCGRSGLKLPAVSLGLWHNFGGVDPYETARAMIHRAFDLGITHFDLANNYGPPAGSAEETFGRVFASDMRAYRDEIVVSAKAGYGMWPGPYGDWGSRKYLLSSLDQSLERMQVDYVDIFYHHRVDPETPLEETMGALDHIVRSGRALYAGISSYPPDLTQKAVTILSEMGTPCLIHQPSYSMFNRRVEDGLLDVLRKEGIGCIAFTPLAQGLLTDRYLNGVPEDSRVAKDWGFLKEERLTDETLGKVGALNEMARLRGQSLAQMAIAWVLRHEEVTTALIGASRVSQIEANVVALDNATFTKDELSEIDSILSGE